MQIFLKHSPESYVGATGMINRLAAIKLVRELELEAAALHFQGLDDPSKHEEILKKEIIDIGCQNGNSLK